MSSEDVLISPIPYPENWQLVKLKDITQKIGSGATPTGGQAAYLETRANFALIRSQNIFDRTFSEVGLAFISDLQAEGLKGVKLQKDDILLNITGDGVTFGRVCTVPSKILPACVNQHVSIIRLNKDAAVPGYVVSYLTHPTIKSYIESFNAGGSRRAITKSHIESFVIPLPPIDVQTEIAQILDAFDSRIAVLRETNSTLEAIAQALFKSWFVDFDPVHANAAALENKEQAPSLPQEIQALFPATFTDSPQGPIPEGWEVNPLDEAAHFLNGLALQKFPATGNEFLPVIKIAQLRKGDTSGADRASRDLKPEYIIQNGDVLFSWSGSLEVAIWCGGEGALNQHLFKVTSNRFPKWFYFLWTKYHLPNFQQIAASKATTMGHIQRKHLTEALVLIPPSDVFKAADDVFTPLIDEFINNSLQASNLAELRDTLLPRLISGQLHLPEAEQAIAAITD